MLKAKVIKVSNFLEMNLNEFLEKNPNIYILRFEHIIDKGHTVNFIIIYKENSSPAAPRLNPDEAPNCPLCGSKLVERVKRSDGTPFWGCRKYPKCLGTQPFSEADSLKFWGPEGDPGCSGSPQEDIDDIPF
jgi:hypothetical protein